MRKNTVKGWLQLARPPVGALKFEKVEFDESIKLAIESLEKQVPKKPNKKIRCYFDDTGDFAYTGTCPNCGECIAEPYDYCEHYCMHCGQSIDWND